MGNWVSWGIMGCIYCNTIYIYDMIFECVCVCENGGWRCDFAILMEIYEKSDSCSNQEILGHPIFETNQ